LFIRQKTFRFHWSS